MHVMFWVNFLLKIKQISSVLVVEDAYYLLAVYALTIDRQLQMGTAGFWSSNFLFYNISTSGYLTVFHLERRL